MSTIYLDYAATTPVDPRVAAATLTGFGAADSGYVLFRGRTVAHVLEHHLTGQHQLDGPPQIAGRGGGE